MDIQIQRFVGDPREWDDFVRSQNDWTHFHLSDWKKAIERVFGHECIYLTARGNDGRIAGILPLVRVKSFPLGHYLVSMPFLNYGGPLGSPEAITALVQHAVQFALSQRVELLELRSRSPLDITLPVSHRKTTVLLDLPESDPDLLWKHFKTKVRNKIRRPKRDGVMVRFGPDQLGPFFRVFSRHMRDLGTPTQPIQLFQAIAETFPNDALFGCAYLDGHPVAGGCGFRWNSEFEMTWSASLKEFNRIRPNMLLYWSFMERAIDEGIGLFNFGRCTPGSGTHDFKRQWGGRDHTLWWYQHATGARASTPSPNDSGYAWGPRIWRYLPVPMANALGPRIAQYIP